MNQKKQKLLSFAMIFAFVFLMNTHKTQASPSIDLSQPVDINGYDVNILDIVAEDSLLWPLLAGFDRLDSDFSQCVTDTTELATNNEDAMRALFPWFWDGSDISGGVDTFCYILDEIPSFMASQLAEVGMQSPSSSETTDIWDAGVVPNWHSINGLIFDHDLVRIEFTEEIDLLSYDFVMMVLDFANAFDVKTGYIALDSDMIQGLKSTGAIITFKNIENFEDPVILVDGKLNERLISALVYDPDAKTITFNTEHFTSFEVVERSSVPVEDDEDKDCKKISGNHAYKVAYQQVKYYKGHDYDLYLALQSVYQTYRTSGDKIRDMLMQEDMTVYDQYKQYRRYHKYKECK